MGSGEIVNNLLISFQQRVVNSSKRMNLVSRNNVENLVQKLTDDSLVPLQWDVCKFKNPVIDIGTGAGFPGIPLKLVMPELELILVDSNRRKCAFLKTAIREMGLTGISVLNDRAENLVEGESNRGQYGTLISRGVGNLGQMLDWADFLLAEEGEIILWKGSGFDAEFKSLELKGWSVPAVFQISSGLILVRFLKK